MDAAACCCCDVLCAACSSIYRTAHRQRIRLAVAHCVCWRCHVPQCAALYWWAVLCTELRCHVPQCAALYWWAVLCTELQPSMPFTTRCAAMDAAARCCCGVLLGIGRVQDVHDSSPPTNAIGATQWCVLAISISSAQRSTCGPCWPALFCS
jgi:hypothetical protein